MTENLRYEPIVCQGWRRSRGKLQDRPVSSVGFLDPDRMWDDGFVNQGAERRAELGLDVLGRPVVVSPGQDQARDPQLAVVQIPLDLVHGLLETTEASHRVQAGIDRNQQLAGIVQEI